MGTSASQRSPNTTEWERVRELYRHPNPDPGHVTAAIVAALEPSTIRGLSDRAVSLSLGTVLEASWRAHTQGLPSFLRALSAPPGPPAMQVALGLRTQANARIVAAQASSRFGDLAVDALGTSAMAIAAGATGTLSLFQLPAATIEANWATYARERRLDDLAACYLAYDLDHAIRYFASRDLGEFVGTEAIPDTNIGSQIIERIGQYSRERVRGITLRDFAPEIEARLAAGETLAAEATAPILEAGVAQGLQRLAGGGAGL